MSDQGASQTRLERYEARTTVLMLVLALAFLALYAVPIVVPDLDSRALAVDEALSIAIWVAFVLDLAIRAYLSGRPGRYLLRHPIDFLLIVLPMLRPLRVLRVFTEANFLIVRGGRFAVGRTLASAFIATAFLMLVASLAVLDAERGAAGANITDFGDAIWWSVVTVTTVGYGDAFPITPQGRVAAFGLMLVGVSLLGVITATVAAWFVQRTQHTEDEVLSELRSQRQLIESLRAELAEVRRDPDGTAGA
jgi:voltage-gated potassium channel